jgi:hypothetical protein
MEEPKHIVSKYSILFLTLLNNGELIWIEVSFPRYKILVCVVYRSPSAINPFWNNPPPKQFLSFLNGSK